MGWVKITQWTTWTTTMDYLVDYLIKDLLTLCSAYNYPLLKLSKYSMSENLRHRIKLILSFNTRLQFKCALSFIKE